VQFCRVAIDWTAQKYAYRMSVELPDAFDEDMSQFNLSLPEVHDRYATIDHMARVEADAIIRDSEEIR